jgi:hypothetical protein
MNRRTRDRKLFGMLAALVAAFVIGLVTVNLFTVKNWNANILMWVVISAVGATAYTIVFNGPEAFWNMITGREKETQ